MNPGKLNKRIKFIQLVNNDDGYGGTNPTYTDILTTWGALEPIRQYNQLAIEAGASVLNEDTTLIIRARNGFRPDKSMLFTDQSDPTKVWAIKSVLPYYPGTKQGFESKQDAVYHDKEFVYIVGIKTEDSYVNNG